MSASVTSDVFNEENVMQNENERVQANFSESRDGSRSTSSTIDRSDSMHTVIRRMSACSGPTPV